MDVSNAAGGPARARFGRAMAEELGALSLRVRLAGLAARALPPNAGYRLRTAILRLGGWPLPRTAVFAGAPMFSGSGPVQTRLAVGRGCWINVGCHLELHDEIRIGDEVAIGHDVLVMTATHTIGRRVRRAGALTTAPVTIGDGAWIGARSVVLPGVRIGEGAIVSAGSTVTADVPPHSVVAGSPAQVVLPRLPG